MQALQQNIVLTVARYLDNEELFLPEPSIRIAISCDLTAAEIETCVEAIRTASENVMRGQSNNVAKILTWFCCWFGKIIIIGQGWGCSQEIFSCGSSHKLAWDGLFNKPYWVIFLPNHDCYVLLLLINKYFTSNLSLYAVQFFSLQFSNNDNLTEKARAKEAVKNDKMYHIKCLQPFWLCSHLSTIIE